MNQWPHGYQSHSFPPSRDGNAISHPLRIQTLEPNCLSLKSTSSTEEQCDLRKVAYHFCASVSLCTGTSLGGWFEDGMSQYTQRRGQGVGKGTRFLETGCGLCYIQRSRHKSPFTGSSVPCCMMAAGIQSAGTPYCLHWQASLPSQGWGTPAGHLGICRRSQGPGPFALAKRKRREEGIIHRREKL